MGLCQNSILAQPPFPVCVFLRKITNEIWRQSIVLYFYRVDINQLLIGGFEAMTNLVEYKTFVRSLAEGKKNKVFLNSDQDKAIVVLVELIRKAQKELRIFAANLCNGIGDSGEYIIAISEFVERGGSIKILLNQYDPECAKNSSLYKRLAYYVSLGKSISIKTTNAVPYRTGDEEKKPIHFTIGDKNSYRIETDIEKRTAECNFNSQEVASGIADFFDKLFDNEATEDVDLVGLFNGGNK